MYNPHETVRALLWYIQLPSWQNQPGIAKMAEVNVDGESPAQEGQVRVRETRIHTTRLAPSPFKLVIRAWAQSGLSFLCVCVYIYIYICQEINTCYISHVLTVSSPVMCCIHV